MIKRKKFTAVIDGKEYICRAIDRTINLKIILQKTDKDLMSRK